ncbi:YdeI/OmpD-associated family protein [Fibrella sp. WM1]|uniref:YdeI/OmpD-associated family protein n=1 Tax=Fibrella musci TaxID=3242485 RepID=UPI003520725D
MPDTLHTFTAPLLRFGDKGEKTGWTYIVLPITITEAMKPGRKTSFRVKGLLDAHPIHQVALIPMGQQDEPDENWNGAFLMAINAGMRKAIRKEAGASITVSLEADDSPLVNSDDLMACLADDPAALAFFESLTPGHQRYYSRWIEEAKTIETKTKRITQAVQGFSMGMGYSEMIRYFKSRKD